MPKSIVIPAEQMDQIEKILDELRSKTRSAFVFLADISGQLITLRGRAGDADASALAALTASNMAATAEIARRLGEKSQFRLMFHEGEQRNIYLAQVGASFLLVVIFEVQVQIGLVRLFSKRAVDELDKLAARYEDLVSQTPSMMEAGFDTAFDDALDDVFSSPGKNAGDQSIIH